MISFPNVKINIGLYITSKRPDGFHNLESIFYPLPFTDVLEILPADEYSFHCYGKIPEGNAEDNLCTKAYRLLATSYDIPPVQIHLLKNIPAGAGLGGGSSDASFTLKMLKELAGLDMNTEEMERLAADLGSDCPFFIKNTPALVKGRGELMEPSPLDLKGSFISLIMPGIHIATAAAFSKLSPAEPNVKLETLAGMPMEEWKGILQNDFEPYAFEAHPEMAEIKSMLYEKGAAYASMTGTGSTIYAISRQAIDLSGLPPYYGQWQGQL